MKTVMAFMFAALLISCNDDKDCTQQAQLFKRVSAQNTRAVASETIIITKDTVINGNVDAFIWRSNGAYTIQVNGYIKTDAYFYNGGANVTATNFIDIGSNLFFNDLGGSVTTHTSIDVNGHAVATQPATITYCESAEFGIIDDNNITLVQDCSLSIDETTGMMYLQDVAVPCDFDFTKQDDPVYYWVKID